jgi:hypothetical protein
VGQLFTWTYTYQTTSWLVCSWSTFGAQTHQRQTWINKIHHGLDLGEATTFLLIVFFVSGHKANTQLSFCPKIPKLGVPKFPKLGLSWFWRPIILCENLQLRWGLKQHCSPCQEISNNMWHATYTKGNQGDSSLLVIESQIGKLILGPSFGHNLCFKCSNGSCEPILDIQVLIDFQWYKVLFTPMSFDPCNRPLKIWKSIRTPTSKVWAHFGRCGFIPSHFPTLLRAWNVTPKLHSWLAPLQALALVMSPRLGLQQLTCLLIVTRSSCNYFVSYHYVVTSICLSCWHNKLNLCIFRPITFW